MNTIIRSKLKALLLTGVVIVFWIAAWELAAVLVGNPYLLPDVPATCRALLTLLASSAFYRVVAYTFTRVLCGLGLGIAFAIVMSVLSARFVIVRRFLSPIVSVIKATPVASFIMILWVIMNGNALAVFIAFLMVFPIVWQNLMDGFNAIDKDLLEVCNVFEFSFTQKMKHLVFPTLMNYFVPAIITASGLAWKSEIAAEIIAYTKKSIGEGINDAKFNYDTATVFAWTIMVIIFSICLEMATKHLLKKTEKRGK